MNMKNIKTTIDIMRNKTRTSREWLLCILLMLAFPVGLWAQGGSALPDGPYETDVEETLLPNGKKRVTGLISDKQGESIIGATIIVKGDPATGTTSDLDGRFTLDVPPKSTLVISYIGYRTREIRVRRGLSRYPVVLEEDNQVLDEVVVIGYGTVKKSDLTGSVSTVGARQFEEQPVKNVADILQGRSAGVEVTSSSGMPGAGAKVRIRGTTSINKSSDPLYVIDGIISSSGLDGLNPQDIQSMEVLKDASSTAIYGSRGANGVILVTTRSGREGRARISFDGKFGLSTVRKNYDLLNAYEYAQALNDVRGSETISAEDMEAYRNGTKGIDWLDLMTQTALTQDYSLGISGGSEKVKYLLSGNTVERCVSLSTPNTNAMVSGPMWMLRCVRGSRCRPS